MEAIYLQSMTDFVLDRFKFWQNDDNTDCQSSARYILGTNAYANFLKQPLQLGFFVPCDENGNVLEKPINFNVWEKMHKSEGSTMGFSEHEKYLKAKERVLFKYFKVVEYSDNTIEIVSDTAPNFIIPFKKLSNKDWEQRYNHIEDLLKSIIKIQLTETAIKQIGL